MNEITKDEYVLTNLDLEGYYKIRLNDDQEYKIYPEGKKDYIMRNGEKVYLSEQVRKWVLSEIKQYERYGI